MAKAAKATAVADIAEQFKEATATLVTEYRGLTVANLKDLRRSLGDSATYTVAKNTLVKHAAAEAGIEGLDDLFVGPTAIAFVKGEAVDAAKAIKTFAKDNKALVIKGGYMLDVIGPARWISPQTLKDTWNHGENPERYPVDTGRLRRVVETAAREARWGRALP